MSGVGAFERTEGVTVNGLVAADAPATAVDHLHVPDHMVRQLMELVDSTDICSRLDAWRGDDRESAGRGGRPAALDDRAVVGLFVLLAYLQQPLHVELAARLIERVLSSDALSILGVRQHAGDGHRWYSRVWRAFHRLLDVVDPYPGPRRILNPDEFAAVVEQRVAEGRGERVTRLDWFANELVVLSHGLLPREVRRRWRGDICIDATPVKVGGKPRTKLSPRTSEPDAGWYVREGDHRGSVDMAGKPAKDILYGWEAHIPVAVPAPGGNVDAFPLVATGIAFNTPGKGVATDAMTILRAMHERGMPVGTVVTDRAYYPNAEASRLQLPARALGWRNVNDYKITDLGIKAGHAGGIQVEGAWYCPSMPTPLIEATIDLRAGRIDDVTYAARIEQRRRYLLKPKEKPDAEGFQPLRCPAIGTSATVDCPLRSNGTPVKVGLTRIQKAPSHPDRICTQSSVSFPPEVGAKYRQDMHYGSPEWHEFYSTARNTIEGFNGFVKDPAYHALGATGRRRVKGRTAHHVFSALLVFAANVRKIRTWIRDAVTVDGELHPTPMKRERRRRRRKERALSDFAALAPPGD